jgi:hypothetical protein
MEQAWQQDHVRPFSERSLVAADPIFLRGNLQGVSRRVRSLGYSAALGAEADHVLASDQRHQRYPGEYKGRWERMVMDAAYVVGRQQWSWLPPP